MARVEIDQRSVYILRNDHSKLNSRVRSLVPPLRRRRMSSSASIISSSTPVDITYVLIDSDIKGVREDSPTLFLNESDIPLTDQETSDSWSVVFQDPPDTDYNKNHTGPLNLFGYMGRAVKLKYFLKDTEELTGTCPSNGSLTTIKFDSNASSTTGEYEGDFVEITDGPGNGQSGTILSYNGLTRIATIDKPWAVSPEAVFSSYKVTQVRHRRLATTVISDSSGKRKVVQYALTVVYYEDGADLTLGKYLKSDYPSYPESEVFPPDGTGTYQKMTDSYFNRKYRGIAINKILITGLCEPLPPPELLLI